LQAFSFEQIDIGGKESGIGAWPVLSFFFAAKTVGAPSLRILQGRAAMPRVSLK